MPNTDRTPMPSKPLCPDVQLAETGRTLELSYRKIRWFPDAVVLLTLVAGAIIGFLTVVVLVQDDLLRLFFVCALVMDGLAILHLVLGWLLHSERVRLGPAGLDYERRLLVTRRRHVALGDLQRVCEGAVYRSGRAVPAKHLVLFETSGKPVE